MAVGSEPNWLIIIGLLYIAYAFGLLALSAVHRGVQSDPVSLRSSEAKQRVCFAFAGITGFLGALMQALGQVVALPEGGVPVLMLLGLIVVLLSYLAFSGRMARLSERVGVSPGQNVLSLHASTSRPYGQAAE